jgi:three-Cys-motif partner protein
MRKPSAPRESNLELFEQQFSGLSSAEQVQQQTFKPLRNPVWSHQKARLIERYLHYFVLVTHHGTYIDGFAGPQAPEHPETWSAKRVLESRPRQLRHFFLCEIDMAKVAMLEQLWASQPPKERKEPKRDCRVLPGDFNVTVDHVLDSGVLKEKEAAFALLDQRTFECHWNTVKKLAAHKAAGNKIELFYFLAVKWLHRAIAGTLTTEYRIDDWWGGDGWKNVKHQNQLKMAIDVTHRFKTELGYKYAIPFPIREKEDGGGSIMYYMIHATDHPAAPGLMRRAYDQAIQPDAAPKQGTIAFPDALVAKSG